MRGQLSPEIRLQISVARLKNGIKKVREENVVLKLQLKEKDQKITELEAKLIDKES